jgi:cold-inducible RNA-binding protein
MGKKLYVGNLRDEVTGGDLTNLFAAHGTVESARIMMDRETGRSKGFAIVEMKTVQEAQAATSALNGQDSGGRALKVREAKLRPRRERNGSSDVNRTDETASQNP